MSCKNSEPQRDSTELASAVYVDKQVEESYNFNSPEVLVLDNKLVEISGLAYNSKKDVLVAHNDEKGYLYELDTSNGKILNEIKFGKKKDYECVEYVNGNYFVGNSNGNLYYYNSETSESEVIKTNLSATNNLEGMCLSSDLKSLLLACKGQPINTSKTTKLRAVYAFNLESKKISTEPYITIADEDLVSLTELASTNISQSQLKKRISRAKEFSPSGIAIHPTSNDYYLISARGSTLLILDNKKTLKRIIFLNNKTNKQPEGICFDKNSNLYISTEGRGLSAKIFKFKFQ